MKVALAAKPQAVSCWSPMPCQLRPEGRIHLNSRAARFTSRTARLQLDDGTLAGSNLTMDEAVRYCVERLGVGLEDALRMASLNPGRIPPARS